MELYNGQQNWTNRIDSPSNITAERVAQIVGWVTFGVGLPAISLAIYMLSQLVKGGNGTPVQAINLLISDIFNLFTRPQTISGSTTTQLETDIPSLIFYFGVASNVVFMVAVAQERHLLVANEHCHGCYRKAKQSSLISLATWAAPIGIVLLLYFGFHLAFSICLLVPFPLLVFFLLDSCRASLCCPTSIRPSQKRRVLAMLVTILANYSILFLPFALTTLLATLQVQISGYEYFGLAANVLLYVSPVINPFISMLLTKNLRELRDTFPCCRRKRTETADFPVVIENPNIDLPLSNIEHSENATDFLPKGMGMSTPNGSSTVFENFNATLGMPGTSTEIPTVSGGLPAPPHMGMTCSQVPTPSGNLTTIPGLPNMGLIGSGGPLSSGGQSNNLTIPGLPNMGMIGSGGPLSSGGQSNNLTIPGLPNMGMIGSGGPLSSGGQSNNLKIPGLPSMGMIGSGGPLSSGGQSNNLTIPALPNMGMIGSGGPLSSGGQSNNLTIPALPNMGMIGSGGPLSSGGQSNNLTIPGLPNMGMIGSGGPLSSGGQSNNLTIPGLPNMGMIGSGGPLSSGGQSNNLTMPGMQNIGLFPSEGPSLLANLSQDNTMSGVPNMNLFSNDGPLSSANLTQDATMPKLPNVGQTCNPLPTQIENLTSMSGLQNMYVNCRQVSTPVGNLSMDGPVVLVPVMGLTCSLTATHLGNLPRDTTMFGLPVVGLICSQVPAPLGNLTRDLTMTDTSDQDLSESGITTKL